MGTSAKPARWIGSGFIAVAALAASYSLGRISAESVRQPQSHQDTASKDDRHLRSTLSAIQKRLADCEKTLQRRDDHVQKREEKPHATEGNPILSLLPELPERCIVPLQARSLKTTAANCTDFRRHFDAYRTILGSNTLDCDTVLRIRGMARMQYSRCIIITKFNEDAEYQDATSDPIAIDAAEDAYATRSEHGDLDDIDKLVKNPECMARMRPEWLE